jgi:hypothetical protein
MDAFVVGTAVVGSFLGAFAIQKVALEGLLRLMAEGSRTQPATSVSRVQGS